MSVINARWLKDSLTEPHECIKEFNKSDILSKTETTNSKVHNYLKWLYENWINGFYVILVH